MNLDDLLQTKLEAWCEFCHQNLTTDLTEDGDLFVCEECSYNLCEMCGSNMAENEVGTSYVCQPCCESRANSTYDAWKEGIYE